MNKGRLTAAGVVLVLGALVVTERTVLVPYRDPVGVVTYCTGLTDPDELLKSYTPEQCAELDRKNIEAHDAGIAQCIPEDVKVSEGRWQAYTHFAFNVGVHAFCKSTLAKRIRRGDARQCEEISRWQFLAGKDCRNPASKCGGIPKRRRFERNWCENETRPPLSMLQ